MDMASRTRSAARLMGLGACAVFALSPFSARAAATDSYYERALMSAANARCHLFEPNLAAALAMTEAQARGAALRAGIDEDQLDQVAERARQGRRTALRFARSGSRRRAGEGGLHRLYAPYAAGLSG